MSGIHKIWKEKDKILEGIRNRIFKKADVEDIAAERMRICETCPFLDKGGSTCLVPGTQPCCSMCGCSLGIKTRALSASCDAHRWLAVLTPQEQEQLDRHLMEDDNSTTDEHNIQPREPQLPEQ